MDGYSIKSWQCVGGDDTCLSTHLHWLGSLFYLILRPSGFGQGGTCLFTRAIRPIATCLRVRPRAEDSGLDGGRRRSSAFGKLRAAVDVIQYRKAKSRTASCSDTPFDWCNNTRAIQIHFKLSWCSLGLHYMDSLDISVSNPVCQHAHCPS